MNQRDGFGLLEVIAAVLIFSIACIAAVTTMAQAQAAVQRGYSDEDQLIAASRFFDAVSLWSRRDLDRHLGWRIQGPWRMYIERITPTVYEVILSDTLTGAVILETALYRPLDRTDTEWTQLE